MSGHWARGYLGLAGADQNGGNGGGVLKLVEGETTWQQVYDALAAGTPVVVPYVEDGTHAYCDYVSAAIGARPDRFEVFIVGQNLSTDSPVYIAETADGVLIANEGD